jgi:hypothetical protein
LIGVISKSEQRAVVEEFFELFKTPWEFYRPGIAYEVVIASTHEMPADVRAHLLLIFGATEKPVDSNLGLAEGSRRASGVLNDRDGEVPIYAGIRTFGSVGKRVICVTAEGESAGIKVVVASGTVLRLGYDLFDESAFLLSVGQPVACAEVPTLDIHIRMLREWIIEAGIPLLEIPPVPADYRFIICLTHDIDFISIRQHFFDHSMWGFVYRATVFALWNFMRRRIRVAQLLQSWLAVASLPLIYAGWVRDFWEPFEWYLKVEEGLSPTYFLIPFKRRPGTQVPGRYASRRAAAYDVSDLHEVTEKLRKAGCEVGVHGIDSWHDAEKGGAERAAVEAVASGCSGIRMHWLLRDENTPYVLERAGYSYDSTSGYNETVGYRAGTVQVFRPPGVQTLLELPLHIQDGALFYPQRLDLTESQAENRCQVLIDQAHKFGGVLTLLWHDRSHGPERFWGEFYKRLVRALRSQDGWFATAVQATDWFRKRRGVRFEKLNGEGGTIIRLVYDGAEIQPPLRIRVSRLSGEAGTAKVEFSETSWSGKQTHEGEVEARAELSITLPVLCTLS